VTETLTNGGGSSIKSEIKDEASNNLIKTEAVERKLNGYSRSTAVKDEKSDTPVKKEADGMNGNRSAIDTGTVSTGTKREAPDESDEKDENFQESSRAKRARIRRRG
jgi:hypothetical protein